MGCNCKKNKTKPLGKAGVAGRKTTTVDNTSAGIAARRQAAARATSYTLTRTDGRTEVYGSRLEADAARVRAGGGYVR